MTSMRISREVAALRDAPLTYSEVGATARHELPEGYRHHAQDIYLGTDRVAFDRVREGLLTWELQARSGLDRLAGEDTVTRDDVVILRPWGLPVWVRCRVLNIKDTENCAGFTYGTLPGHPECGEERFEVTVNDAGEVHFSVRAFSRPGTWFVAHTGRAPEMLQNYATRRYMRAAHALARGN